MGNDVVPYDQIERMAQAVAKSGLFGVKDVSQALALMLVAQAEGRHPALAARDYDIIQNRPSKKSEAMLRDFLESGGKVEWHQLDDTAAIASFSHPAGGTVKIDWTMKRAVSAGLGGKDMWKKYPRQMLRARTVSEGIRTVCPMATSGMYVPEEVKDFVQERNITPTAGASDNVSPEDQDKIKELADKVVTWLNADSVGDAYLEIENAALEPEQKIYLWTMFDSKQRSALKKEAARAKAALAPPIEQEPQSPQQQPVDDRKISDAQRKRLEAIIGEKKLDRLAVKAYCMELWHKNQFVELHPEEYKLLDEEIQANPARFMPPASKDFVQDLEAAEQSEKKI